jgi:drug/metabolite transporter (DMT)-like permease
VVNSKDEVYMPGNHHTTGRWRLGASLAFLAMLSWATLPVALTLALAYVDAWTLTWFRFLVATLSVGIWLRSRGMLVWPGRGGNRGWALLIVAAASLTSNYMLFIIGLELTSPALAQVLIQLAPVLLGLGGIWLFGERYSRAQWVGFSVLVTGLGLFFRDQLGAFAEQATQLWQGALLIVLGAVAWAAYALAQKQMLQHYPSVSIMWFIYVFATIVLLPAIAPTQLWNLSLDSFRMLCPPNV